MAYQMYTTRALILSSRERSAADRVVRMFTETAGMVDARAAAVREEKSKMRYALQPLSFARVTLVRGKREWRVTGAEPDQNLFFAATDRTCRAGIVHIARTLERLVRGEEEARSLFTLIEDGVLHLRTESHEDASRILVLRALATLGYVAPSVQLVPLVDAPTLASALAHAQPGLRLHIDAHIEQAYAVSHL